MKTLFVLTLMTIMFIAPLVAQPDAPSHGRPFKGIIKKLNLSDDQQKQVDKIHADLQKQMIDQRAKVASLRVDLKQLLKADSPDKAAIEKMIKNIGDVQTAMKTSHIDAWFTVNKLLNAEQQKVWKKALADGPRMNKEMAKKIFEGRKGPRARAEKSPH